MEIIGYIGAVLIGLSLGLIGGGGSILSVPILVYMFSIEPVMATSYSLFIVGITSLVGSISHIKQKTISFKTAVVFGIPSVVTVFLTRKFLIPAIPQEIAKIGSFTLTKSVTLLVLFAAVMILASYFMIKKENPVKSPSKNSGNKYFMILAEGTIVGLLTGLVGAGGGFLIIPALVLLAKLPIKQAIGTSLLIISAKSLIGFLGDINTDSIIDWQFLVTFSGISLLGMLVGMYLFKKVSAKSLKPAFGWFVLIIGVLIILKEIC